MSLVALDTPISTEFSSLVNVILGSISEEDPIANVSATLAVPVTVKLPAVVVTEEVPKPIVALTVLTPIVKLLPPSRIKPGLRNGEFKEGPVFEVTLSVSTPVSLPLLASPISAII